MGKVLWMQSHIFMKNLKLLFIIPQSSNQAFIYYEYLAYLLNKKEENSLYIKLSSLNLISHFESKISRALTTHIQFELNFNLTQQGIGFIPLITSKAFGHLANVTNSGIDQNRFHEFVNIKRLLLIYFEEDQRARIKRLSLYLRNKRSIDDYLNFTSDSYIVNSKMNYYITPKHSFIILESDKIDIIHYSKIKNNDSIISQYENHFKTLYYSKDLTKEDIDNIASIEIEPINSSWANNPFITNNIYKIDFDREKLCNEMEPKVIFRSNRVVVRHLVRKQYIISISLIDHFHYR